jgi:hypothetical protein
MTRPYRIALAAELVLLAALVAFVWGPWEWSWRLVQAIEAAF